MTEEEMCEFLKGISNLDIWKMAEGNPNSFPPENTPMSTKLSGEAFYNEKGELVASKQMAEYIHGNREIKQVEKQKQQ